MNAVNADYHATMARWSQFTANKLDFDNDKLKQHRNHVYAMREYHACKDLEQYYMYQYHQGKLEIAQQQQGQHVDVRA